MRKRRAFSREFKREAATMVLDQGHPLAHICLQLDVSENGLRRWVQQIQYVMVFFNGLYAFRRAVESHQIFSISPRT